MSSPENEDSENEAIISVKRIKKRTITDSDSDEDISNQLITNANFITNDENNDTDIEDEVSINKQHSSVNRIKKLILDSDSEEENHVAAFKPFEESNEITDNMSMGGEISDSDLIPDDSQKSSQPVYKPYFNSDLYDAEESDEETGAGKNKSSSQNKNFEFDKELNNTEGEENYASENSTSKSNQLRKDKKKEKKKKEKVKSSSESIREIRRESQRMVRESSCVLPYHRPKKRTLAEFIQRRKAVPSIPLKTNQEHLMRIGKQIEELEKQSEEFFKSDVSEDSDEEYIPNYLKNKNNNLNSNGSESNLNEDIKVKDLNVKDVVILVNNHESDSQSNCNLFATNSCNENHDKEKLDESCIEENVDSHESQNDNTDKDTLELLDKVKQKLFAELGSSNPLALSETENIDNNAKISEDFHFELRISEDSNPLLESKSINENECEKSSLNTFKESDIITDITIQEKADDKLHLEEPSCVKGIESPVKENLIKTITSSHSYCFQNSEDFSLRIDDSEEIAINSEEIEKDENCKAKVTEVTDSDPVNKMNFVEDGKQYSESDKTSQNCNSTEDCTKSKTKITENDVFKNKFQNIDIDLNKVPKLMGNSNDKINLYSPPKSSAILDLKERFFRHYSMEKNIKVQEKVEISVVSAEVNSEGTVSDIKQEIINSSVNKSEEKWLEDIKEAQQPGAKLAKLKAHLQKKLQENWKEDWNKRCQEYKLNEEEKIDEDVKSDYEDDAILDDENVETDSTETESEEELEENDVPLVDKKRSQNKFLDDEADETDGEGGDNDHVDNEVEEDEDVLLGNNYSDMESNEDNDEDDAGDDVLLESDSNKDEEDEDDEEEDSVNQVKEATKKTVDSEENILTPATDKVISTNKDFLVDNELSQISNKNSEFFVESQQEYKPGKFECIEDLVNNTEGIEKLSQSDIIRICSGTFPSQPVAFTQLEDSDEKLKYSQFSSSQSQSQDLNLPLPDFSQDIQNDKYENLKDLRKKTSILESDEEDEIFEKSQKNKKQRKINYSDDEDENDNIDDNKEANDYGDGKDEEEEEEGIGSDVDDIIGNEDEEAEVEYDSEENEVIKDGKSFLENEAELSESEWGSDDEDEKDLDRFEAEAGDEDELDQEQLKGELGKIHMQRMLVDDKNEVMLLKELLLEDGELHGDESGRVRRFRWANTDDDFPGVNRLKDSDDDDSDREDEDENWRSKRHEREVYIQKQQEKLRELGIEDVIDGKKDNNENDLLDMGRAMLKKIQKIQPVTKPLIQQKTINIKVGVGPNVLPNSAAQVKRGSFLKSSNNFLSRLAHITSKIGTEGNVNGPKNSRNFVFSVVSPPKKGEENDETNKKMAKKRKADENVQPSKKKIHFSDDTVGTRKSLFEMLTPSNQ